MEMPELSSPVLRSRLLAVSAVIGLAVFLVPPFVADVGFGATVSALALPLLALGALDMVLSRSWPRLAFSIALPIAAYLVSSDALLVVLLLTFGSAGVPAAADMLCRRRMLPALRRMEHSEGGRLRDIERFMVGAPSELDMRDMRVDWSVHRESVPWGLRISACISTAVPMLIVWVAAGAAGAGMGCMVAASVLALYIAVPAVSLTVLDTAGVRTSAPGIDFRLYPGLQRTLATMAAPLTAALIVVLAVGSVGASTLLLIAGSLAFDVLDVLLSMIRFERRCESPLMRDLAAEWDSDHPVLLYAGLDGRPSRREDDVPGTPTRAKGALPAHRNRSLNAGLGLPPFPSESKIGMNTWPEEYPSVLCMPMISGSS